MADSVEELLAGVSTDDALDVDTSFLDAYRRTGTAVSPSPDEQLQPGSEPYVETTVGAGSAPSQRAGDTVGVIPVGASQAQPSGQTPVSEMPEPAPAVESAGDQAASEPHPQSAEVVSDELTAVSSHRKTEQQGAIQSAASSGTRADGGSGAALPSAGFCLTSTEKQPYIRNVPNTLTSILKEQLRSAAVREKGVSDAAAQAFCQPLGQAALVTAFLMAQLDVRLDADASTTMAAELFRSQDPLLGAVVARMDELERRDGDQAGQLKKLIDHVAAIERTVQVVEQGLAYSIADKTENLVRGAHNVGVVDPTHRSAMVVRDRVREATARRMQLERERDGRPIR